MSRYQFICMERGCGPCGVKLIDAVYLETRTHDGKLVASESAPRLVSTCCGAGFEIWDNRTEDTAVHQAAIAEQKPLTQQAAPQAEQQAVRPFLVRDVAELLSFDVPTFCRAMEQIGLPRGSTNSAIDPEDALRVAKVLATQLAEHEPFTADVECITDESGTGYSVSVRGPGIRNPLYSDVWLKKEKQAELLKEWLNTDLFPVINRGAHSISKDGQR